MTEQDGEPAYFQMQKQGHGGVTVHGMSLRDWYAGQEAAAYGYTQDVGEKARHCYRFADAMLEEREST